MRRSVRSSHLFCIVAVTALILAFLSLNKNVRVLPMGFNCASASIESSCPQIFSKIFQKVVSAYRKCLLDSVEGKNKTYWKYLHEAVDKCLGDTVRQMLEIHALTNSDDVKYVILVPNDPQSDRCTQVTLGVGNDIQSEEKLRRLAPNCIFFGADPILASGEIFRNVGTYFEVAVGAEAGYLEASVLEDGTYRPKNVRTVTLVDFLKNYAEISKVDYLFMDNEGPEYRLLWQFVRGGLIEQEKISVCQLSIEFHGPFVSYGVDAKAYETLISALINNSSLVPMWSIAPHYHARAFYVNVEDRYCVDKFLMPRICTE